MRCLLLFIVVLAVHSPVWALRFDLKKDQDIVGGEQVHRVKKTQTLMDVARYYDMGYEELRRYNPKVSVWTPKNNSKVYIPSRFILPQVEHRQGIVINLAEMRLYYFPNSDAAVYTFPIGIGRTGWETPTAETKIRHKTINPTWKPPKSILLEHLEMEDPLPQVVKAGPQNPLGQFAMRLGIPGYLIHGTNKPDGVGMRISHGCIRMYPEDIALLYDLVAVNTKVQIVNQPYKFGLHQNELYLETHLSLEQKEANNFTPLVRALMEKVEAADSGVIDKAVELAGRNHGFPELLTRLKNNDWYLQLGNYDEDNGQEFQFYRSLLKAPVFYAQAEGKCRWLAGPFSKRKSAEAELERLRRKSLEGETKLGTLKLISLGEKKSCTPI